MTEKQFYTELIRQCEVVLPMVNEYSGLCYYVKEDSLLNMVIKVCVRLSPRYPGSAYYASVTRFQGEQTCSSTPAWKQDRIELLNEIIHYCKSKL